MAWEKISKNFGRGGKPHGKEWSERPCISIGKTVISFNRSFVDVFCGGGIKGLFVLFDPDRRAIGFKVPSRDQIEDANSGWYSVGNCGKRGRNVVYISGCQRLLKQIPDLIGRTYRAKMNPEERVIEVLLTDDNLAR